MSRNPDLHLIAAMAPEDQRKISEYSFQVAVCHYAESQGWRVHYARKSGALGTDGKWRGSGPRGFPDLVLAKRWKYTVSDVAYDYTRVKYRELKKEGGQLSPEQREWAEVLGDLWALWKPRDAKAIIQELGEEL